VQKENKHMDHTIYEMGNEQIDSARGRTWLLPALVIECKVRYMLRYLQFPMGIVSTASDE
jgi:hypothetical protein